MWSKYHGESESRLAGRFSEARRRSPSIVLIDDVDALCPRRDKSNNEVEYFSFFNYYFFNLRILL